MVYKEGTLNYFECKAIHGNTLNFKSYIRDNQWNGLLAKSFISGINAGIICWFIDVDKTVFLDIQDLQYLSECENKSFNIMKDINKIPVTEIDGIKKRVFFEYNLEKFLEDISYA